MINIITYIYLYLIWKTVFTEGSSQQFFNLWFRRVGDWQLSACADMRNASHGSHLALSPFLTVDTVCRQAEPPWLSRRCCVSSANLRSGIRKHIHFLRRRRRIFILRTSADYIVSLQWRCRRFGTWGCLYHDVSSQDYWIFAIFSCNLSHSEATSTSPTTLVSLVYAIMRYYDAPVFRDKFSPFYCSYFRELALFHIGGIR